jgi:serine phosphatase RsbU (regulator of sigma subunit)
VTQFDTSQTQDHGTLPVGGESLRADALPATVGSAVRAGLDAPARLTDYIDSATLQDIQDSLASVARVKATILDDQGVPLTHTTVSKRFQTRSAAIAASHTAKGDSSLDQPFSAPIVVRGQRLGSIVIEPAKAAPVRAAAINELAGKLQLPPAQVRTIIDAVNQESLVQRTASVQFLYLLANAISRLCEQEIQLRRRIVELSTLFNISNMLTEARGLQQTLDRVTFSVTEALNVKACSLRLLDDQRDEMVIKSVYNLSDAYLRKGPIMLGQSGIDREALEGKVVYIPDVATDPRIIYRDDGRREGIVSVLCTALIYRDRPIGVLRVYSAERKEFSDFEVKLLQSISGQAAAAIENARLQQETVEKERLQRQVQIAAEVQRRMIPAGAPVVPGFDIAALYAPCFELGGDFYDFIEFGTSTLGIAVADVVGKGLPASLLMASVRAAIRAYANDIYDLDEIIARVNRAMVADTRSNEFITLWYGTLNYSRRQLTYCAAGHDPALLVRNGTIQELSAGGMVLGVDPSERYIKEVLQLQPGDLIFIYTDGLSDAVSFSGEKFGKARVRETLLRYRECTAEQICQNMIWETRRFVGLNRRTDDTTLVAVRVTQ